MYSESATKFEKKTHSDLTVSKQLQHLFVFLFFQIFESKIQSANIHTVVSRHFRAQLTYFQLLTLSVSVENFQFSRLDFVLQNLKNILFHCAHIARRHFSISFQISTTCRMMKRESQLFLYQINLSNGKYY